jgi:hypothetical protein
MLMPFGKHKGQELNTLANSYLEFILRDVQPEPVPLHVLPENREQYIKTRRALRMDAERILKERRANGVKVIAGGDVMRKPIRGRR